MLIAGGGWDTSEDISIQQVDVYVPTYKKTSPIGLVLHFVLRRERDSLAQFFARIVRDQLGRDKSPRPWV